MSSAGGAPTTHTTRRLGFQPDVVGGRAKDRIREQSPREPTPLRGLGRLRHGADGSGIRQLTFSNAFDGDPAWSVSNRIAFESERTGSSDVWAIDSDGSDETQLTKNSAFDEGSRVVSRRLEDRFHERAGQRRSRDLRHERRRFGPDQAHEQPRLRREPLVVAERQADCVRLGARRQPRGLRHERRRKQADSRHQPSGAGRSPSWSQNSKQIVFVTDRIRKGQRRLYVANADGSHVRMLTRNVFDMSPDWARG